MTVDILTFKLPTIDSQSKLDGNAEKNERETLEDFKADLMCESTAIRPLIETSVITSDFPFKNIHLIHVDGLEPKSLDISDEELTDLDIEHQPYTIETEKQDTEFDFSSQKNYENRETFVSLAEHKKHKTNFFVSNEIASSTQKSIIDNDTPITINQSLENTDTKCTEEPKKKLESFELETIKYKDSDTAYEIQHGKQDLHQEMHPKMSPAVQMFLPHVSTPKVLEAKVSVREIPQIKIEQPQLFESSSVEVVINVQKQIPIISKQPVILRDLSIAEDSDFQHVSKETNESFIYMPQVPKILEKEIPHMAAFLPTLKEQIEKFQRPNDKKVTIQMRSNGKNLTIILSKMPDDSVNAIFRTTDKEWQVLLQQAKGEIEQILPYATIKYLGE